MQFGLSLRHRIDVDQRLCQGFAPPTVCIVDAAVMTIKMMNIDEVRGSPGGKPKPNTSTARPTRPHKPSPMPPHPDAQRDRDDDHPAQQRDQRVESAARRRGRSCPGPDAEARGSCG